MVKTPLYGHRSEANAYEEVTGEGVTHHWLVETPHGWAHYWKDRKGLDTEHPFGPTSSVGYFAVESCLYLDENGRVRYTGLNLHCGPEVALEFVCLFPETPLTSLLGLARSKAKSHRNWSKVPNGDILNLFQETRLADAWDKVVYELQILVQERGQS